MLKAFCAALFIWTRRNWISLDSLLKINGQQFWTNSRNSFSFPIKEFSKNDDGQRIRQKIRFAVRNEPRSASWKRKNRSFLEFSSKHFFLRFQPWRSEGNCREPSKIRRRARFSSESLKKKNFNEPKTFFFVATNRLDRKNARWANERSLEWRSSSLERKLLVKSDGEFRFRFASKRKTFRSNDGISSEKRVELVFSERFILSLERLHLELPIEFGRKVLDNLPGAMRNEDFKIMTCWWFV